MSRVWREIADPAIKVLDWPDPIRMRPNMYIGVMSDSDYLLWIGCGTIWEGDFDETHEPDNPPNGEDVTWHVFPEVEITLCDKS